MSTTTAERAIRDIQHGKMVIVCDDESRENEGDLCIAAEHVTPAALTFMARHACGLICLAMMPERLDQLGLPLMAENPNALHGTAFTISIDAIEGVSTGISSADRAVTIHKALDPAAQPHDFARPGHIFPLRACPEGVLGRRGQTEGSVDLARLAGLQPAGVICEIMNADGTMARRPQLEQFAAIYGFNIVTIADLVAYREAHAAHHAA
ncbi:3,4-dihydroxy-2-butanone-4-phosphate synthase [Candidatus Entotheonella palauensis]|uniref:3,4-dihydroxy-2-butanone 4-phosphate synthase n=1 Tax=Candidatus Entotheonella gemina TaxID=1429439 RepID=W4M7B0_9BACT|nr:3,4-dihydroxy-2-butanone-4-phosphate synthase [Candidatus Entotheonella palauensis]ETX05781.1 MAG: 3,4-dihydroxy-2-butanone 4-phosphate synthase [Candidatus Entotheonella gemina]